MSFLYARPVFAFMLSKNIDNALSISLLLIVISIVFAPACF